MPVSAKDGISEFPNAIIAVAVLTLSVWLPACGEKPDSESADAAQPPISSWPATTTSDGGGFSVTLQPIGGEIARNEHFSLKLSIEAAPGSGNGAKTDPLVVVDADMPAHRHGMNTQPETTALGDQQYRIDGMLFHMAGDWVITVDISTPSNPERASFPVRVD